METQTAATIEDLWAVEGKAELVGGRVVPMAPTGEGHSRIVQNIVVALRPYEGKETGYTLSDPAGFLVNLPGRQSFSPDVGWVGELGDDSEGFHFGPPLFAVEVRSKNDHGPTGDREYEQKRREYFAAGTLVVWDVNPRTRTIASYRRDGPDPPVIFRAGQAAHAEPALPGWRAPVDELFRLRSD